MPHISLTEKRLYGRRVESLSILMGLVLLWLKIIVPEWIRAGKIRLFQTVSVIGLCICLITQGVYKYSPEEGNYVSEFADNNEALLSLASYAGSNAVADIQDETVWRYDTSGLSEVYNTPVQLGQNGVSYYWSLADGNIFRFQKEMYSNQEKDFRYQNLDGRSFLDVLASVKYFALPSGTESYLPYGYTQPVNTRWTGKDWETAQQRETAGESTERLEASKVSTYTTENWLPLGYTYDRWISREGYESMNVVQKQQALLQGVVLDSSSLTKADPVFEEKIQSCTVTAENGIEQREKGILVRTPGSSMTLSFQGASDSETYFILENLDYQGIRPSEQYTEEEWDTLSEYEKNEVKKEDKMWSRPDTATITVTDGINTKNINYLNQVGGTYSDIHDFLINIGYSQTEKTSLTLIFQKAGYYSWDNYSVVCQPVGSLSTYVKQRKQNVLEDISIFANHISGNIHASKNEALFLTIPYSKSWTAEVDGRSAELMKANTMYMALELEKGDHEIVLRYRTPGLITGGILTFGTAAGCSVWLGISAVRSRRRKKPLRKEVQKQCKTGT